MDIDSHPEELYKLLPITEGVRYFIPDYQRNYSWNDEQIRQLFLDINNEPSGYYVGNLLVTQHQEPQPNSEENNLDVIDGQQRLITLSLLLLAIWQQLTEWSDDEDKESDVLTRSDLLSIGEMRGDIRRMLLTGNSDSSRIVPLDSDRQIYDDLLSALNGHKPQASGRLRFTKRYNFIRSLIADELSTTSEIKEFYDKLLNIKILQIKVISLSDAFMVFSSLNSKGLPLTLVDLLKGEFLGAAKNHGDDINETLSKWNLLTSFFHDKNNDVNIGSATQFLLNNYDAFEGTNTTSTTKSKALGQYQRIIRPRYEQGIDYLKQLIDRASLFSQIACMPSAPDDGSRIGKKLQSLHRLEPSQAYPLLLFVLYRYEELHLDEAQLSTVIDALIYFYVRRNVTLLPKASGIRSTMLDIVRSINNQQLKGSDLIQFIIQRLKNLSVGTEEFRNSLLSADIYEKNPRTTRFLLTSLERNLSGPTIFDKGREEDLDSLQDDNGKPKWTIEHILPEGTLPDYWKDAISPDSPKDADKIQDEHTHKLGNLTLTPYNADLGQLPFVNTEEPYTTGTLSYKKSKRDFSDNGHFVGLRQPMRLNASIPDESIETIETKTQWTIADIERRTKILTDFIVNYYDFDNLR
ncbi:DUF262 domain-containing protein [Bifidobacterium sp. ESL0704]|uniref:DUF262 domain-containing protein n=1 Tax=Bifidobacterium sp. ESL0704 TaxID=2983219 RepID=UPI0023FA0E8D|nr:DUF262 domain-containing protein [Bifidobacterium sp. ESL0704]WEV53332.1 DUF262 domain-containing protein [Bifidobacterium sp. ESL0704]